MGKIRTARHRRYDTIIWRMRFVCCLNNARYRQSDYLQLFQINKCYTTPPQYYGISKLPVFLCLLYQIVLFSKLTIKFLHAIYKRTHFN